MKMMHIENLKTGQWVVVVAHKAAGQVDMFGREAEYEFTGVPHRVKSVCPPFVAVEYRGHVAAIDTRVFELMPVHPKYVQAMESAVRPKRRRRKEKPDPNKCPRCGTNFQRRVITVEGRYAIQVFCPECHWDNGLLECVN
jgi:hypothetical protein